jgi:hypothetical protein
MSELEFTPEYIAKSRKANGGVWVFPETKEALDEIERLQAQLTSRDAMIVNMLEIGNRIVKIAEPEHRAWEKEQLERWGALVAEWKERKDE